MKKYLLLIVCSVIILSVHAQTTSAKSSDSSFVQVIRKLKLTGYTQPRFQYFTDTARINSFDIRRARLALTGSMTGKIEYRFFAEFAGSVPPQLLEAIFTYKLYGEQFKFSVGQMLVPLGNDIIASETKMESVNRAVLSEALGARGQDVIGNQNARDIGAEFSGIVKTNNGRPWLNYATGIFNGSGINKFDNNKYKAFATRIVISPLKGLQLGGSYYNGSSRWGDDITINKNRDRWGIEAEYKYKIITLRSEYMQGVDDTITKGGYYIQLIGNVIPDKIQLSGRIEFFDYNKSISNDGLYIYTLCPSYMFGEHAKIQLGYDLVLEQGPIQKKNNIFQTQFQLAF